MAKELFSTAAIVLTFMMFAGYIRQIHSGRIKPHVFSWVIWGIGTLTVFFAQLAGGAGVGAWPIGLSGAITFYIAVLSYAKRADTEITATDWMFFVAALSAFPAWYFTANPLWAVVILTFADLAGFGPTVRRAYHQPALESTWFYGLGAVRNLLVVLALEHYSVTTALFPVAVGAACLLLAALLVVRRKSRLSTTRPHDSGATMNTSRPFHRLLEWLLLLYCAASLVHFAHNAEFLADYPNLPSWLSRAQIYAVWLGITAIGVAGYILGRVGYWLAGLIVIAVYAGLGFDGLLHYGRAPFAEHTAAMNFSILFEVTTAALLLACAAVLMVKHVAERTRVRR